MQGHVKDIAFTHRPIGVFDSGVGGLTVLQALCQRLPQESYLYLGDTARLPYGTKSDQTVIRYAAQAVQLLVDRGIKLLVVACNTASAIALPALQAALQPLPVIGVLEPGAQMACELSTTGHIGILATEATIAAGGYQRAIHSRQPEAVVSAQSASVLVSLAEEGWLDNDIAQAAVQRYLQSLQEQDSALDCIVLGCTHFPALLPAIKPAIKAVVGNSITLVNSAEAVATAVEQVLLNGVSGSNIQNNQMAKNTINYLVTDGPKRFQQVARRLLQWEVASESIQLVDVNQYSAASWSE